MAVEPVLIAGEWREATLNSTFTAENPATGRKLEAEFPISQWKDCDAALTAAVDAARTLRSASGEQRALFLEGYAKHIEEHVTAIVELANQETGLAITPRLKDVEIPRTTTQLRQGAAAAREGSWTHAVIDSKANIRSHFAPIGPVVVFGPNNFPFAFNGISGGDFTAAIASSNPAIADLAAGKSTAGFRARSVQTPRPRERPVMNHTFDDMETFLSALPGVSGKQHCKKLLAYIPIGRHQILVGPRHPERSIHSERSLNRRFRVAISTSSTSNIELDQWPLQCAPP